MERGNTVLVIEHNLDVVKVADYVVDLGPEGGEGGREVMRQRLMKLKEAESNFPAAGFSSPPGFSTKGASYTSLGREA